MGTRKLPATKWFMSHPCRADWGDTTALSAIRPGTMRRLARPTALRVVASATARRPDPTRLGFDFVSLVGGVSYSNFLEAFDVALDLATTAQPLSEAIIRRLHERVTDPQDT